MDPIITQFVTWENLTTSVTSVTQLGVRTIVTLANTPLILVMDKFNTREDSQVSSREWRAMYKWFGKIIVSIT
jgi:hypothetical protein